MPYFVYTARTKAGKPVQGTAFALTKQHLINNLQQEGLLIISMKEAAAVAERRKSLHKKAKNKDLILFAKEFAVLLENGIPIIEAQSRGLPVIIYGKGKIAQETSKHCFIAKDATHMAKILEELKRKGYDKRKQLAAIKYARGFTRKKEALDTLEVYRKIIQKD